MNKLLAELQKRHVFRVVIAYAAVSWVVAQVAEFAFDTFGAPDWVLQALVVVLLIGLPIAAILAWAYEITPDGVKRDVDVDHDDDEVTPSSSRRGLVIASLVVVVAATSGYLLYDYRQAQDAKVAAMAEFQTALELTEQDRYGEAFAILQSIESTIGDLAEFQSLFEEITIEIDPRVSDPDAVVRFRPYDAPDADFVEVSDQSNRAPLGGLLLRVEKPGFETRELAVANPGPMTGTVPEDMLQYLDYPIPEIELYETGEVPEGMVRVPRTDINVFLAGFAVATEGDQRRLIPAFDIGKYEVTNREFKAFVDDGGYGRPEFWRGQTTIDGSVIDDTIIDAFTDTSGRPGPATWELGNYLPGTADDPVGGISLYEARAFARYSGMSLPTIHHFTRAAYGPVEGIYPIAPFVARGSNFGQVGAEPATTKRGVGPWGTFHTAGNNREWVWNTTDELGISLGGAWTNYTDIYQVTYTIDPMDRAPENGMRLMHTLGEPVDSTMLEPIELNWGAMTSRREPVSDEAFEAMRFQFTHVRREPASVSVEIVEENDQWIAEEVILTYAGDETFTLYVVKPANPPDLLQAVIYMPHSGMVANVPNRRILSHLNIVDHVVKAGRALIMPIWYRTAERFAEVPPPGEERDDFLRRNALTWYEDAATTIDYLESRDDFGDAKVGFFGISYGAYRSSIFLALEDRIGATVLMSGGAPYWDAVHPMYDPVNYYPRMTMPVLMINGRHDHLFTYENSQLWMLELLGTPGEDKTHLVFEQGHFDFPRRTVVREVSDFYDRYLGPVR